MFFYLMLFAIICVLIFMLVYLNKYIRQFKFFDKIKNKYLKIIVTCIPFLLLFIFFNMTNTLIILVHIFLFALLTQFLLYLIDRIWNKKIPKYFIVVGGVLITSIYLGIGFYLDHHVWETHYEIHSTKDIGVDKFRIVQIADSHIGATFDGDGFGKHIDRINKLDSDIVVITGDFVDDDTNKEDLDKSCDALGRLKTRYGVYFVNGNHDKGYFEYRNYSYEDLKEKLTSNGVIVLEDQTVEITDKIYLVGRKDKAYVDRKSIAELTNSLDKTKYIIDLNHQPNDYENEKNAGVDLVLSGHTHGGQLFPLGYLGLLSGANDATYGLSKRGNTNYIVNSGISNWSVDFKTGTKSEYGVIDIINKNGD